MNGRDLARQMLLSSDFSCPVTACAMVRRSAYERVGYRYDHTFGFLSDMDMWLRICLDHDVGYLKEPLLTCRERDQSHEFSRVDWRLPRWAVAIHEKNIERHFSNDPATLHSARTLVHHKRDRLYRRTLLAALAQRNLHAFREGLELISTLGSGGDRLIARALISASGTHELLMTTGAGLNSIRRWVTRTF